MFYNRIKLKEGNEMKKLLTFLLAIQTLLLSAGCCPCGDKAPEQSQSVSEETQKDDLQLIEQEDE